MCVAICRSLPWRDILWHLLTLRHFLVVDTGILYIAFADTGVQYIAFVVGVRGLFLARWSIDT